MIKLTGGFSVVPEGIHVFRITEVEYKEEYGKLEVRMVTAKGNRHTERFSLLDSSGKPNEGALNAFSFFAKTAMNDYDLESIDEQALVGRYIRCTVTHDQVTSNKGDGKILTFARLGDKSPADGFDEEPAQTAAPASVSPVQASTSVTRASGGFDLDSILG